MDHKVSKDMISSGMIPSGEKTQADLGRTQYGSAPSPNKLMDAYKSMYDKKEEVINEHHQKDKDGNTIPHEGEELNELKSRTMLDYIDKASDSASKELDKAEKTTSRKKEVKARLKMDKRERGIEMAKDKIMKRVKEEVDTYDIVLDHFLNEGYEKEDILKVMSTVNLTEEPITATLAAIGAGLAKGAAVAAKGAMGAVKAGSAALKSGMKGVVSAAKGGISAAKNVIKPKPKVTSSGGNVVQGSSDTGGNKIMDFAKREGGNMLRQKALQGGQPSGTDKTKQTSAAKTDIAASADLFDIVKGQLLDEGLSEEEIRDIMLTLTPDEIMSEMAVNPNIAAMDAKNKADMIARAQANKVPDKVKEASKRQMKAGTPREDPKNPYTTQDKKTIIDYNKDK